MSNTWKDHYGRHWYGDWRERLDGSWGYLMSPEGADTDMSEMDMDEVHKYFGPLTMEPEKMTTTFKVNHPVGFDNVEQVVRSYESGIITKEEARVLLLGSVNEKANG